MQGTKGKVDSPFTCDVIACLVWLGLALGGTNSLHLHGIDDYLQTKNTIVQIIPHDRQALFHTDEFSRVFLSCNGGWQVLGLVFRIIKTSQTFIHSVIVVVFQIVFRVKIYINDIFFLKKIIFDISTSKWFKNTKNILI